MRATTLGFPVGQLGKNLPANTGDARDEGLITGLGTREKDRATHSSVLAERIPWTEEPGRLLGQTESALKGRTVS